MGDSAHQQIKNYKLNSSQVILKIIHFVKTCIWKSRSVKLRNIRKKIWALDPSIRFSLVSLKNSILHNLLSKTGTGVLFVCQFYCKTICSNEIIDMIRDMIIDGLKYKNHLQKDATKAQINTNRAKITESLAEHLIKDIPIFNSALIPKLN